MFGLAAGFYQSYLKAPQVNIVFVGLDDSGKTALLERVKVTDFSHPVPKSRPKHLRSHNFHGGNNSRRNEQSITGTSWAGVVVTRKDLQRELQRQMAENKNNLNLAPSSFSEERKQLIQNDKYRKNFQNDGNNSNSSSTPSKQTNSRRRMRIICPVVPSSYRRKYSSDEYSSDEEEDTNIDNLAHNSSGIISLPQGDPATITHPPILHGQQTHFSLKPGCKMFPLHLIRPTVGMNLAKIEAYSAKCHIMDLGGSEKMRPLWERYYGDADAIVFVVDASAKSKLNKMMEARAVYRHMRDDDALKETPILIFANKMDEYNDAQTIASDNLSEHDNNTKTESVNGSNNETNEFEEVVVEGKKVEESQTVGSLSIIKLAQLFVSTGNVQIHDILSLSDEEFWEREQRLQSLRLRNKDSKLHDQQILADYSFDDNAVLCGGSAKTGEGVRAAFDWLIPKAKEIRSERDQQLLYT